MGTATAMTMAKPQRVLRKHTETQRRAMAAETRVAGATVHARTCSRIGGVGNERACRILTLDQAHARAT